MMTHESLNDLDERTVDGLQGMGINIVDSPSERCSLSKCTDSKSNCNFHKLNIRKAILLDNKLFFVIKRIELSVISSIEYLISSLSMHPDLLIGSGKYKGTSES